MKARKPTQSKTMKTALIAPCGMNCRLCIGYIREKNKCPGCFMIDAYKSKTRVGCRIRMCEKIKQLKSKFCFDCDTFPCAKLKQLDKRYRTKYSMSMIENQKYIKQFGIRKFVREEKEKWTCPNCSQILSVHRDNCPSCDYKWR
jgi:hypothetical protein